MYRHFVTALLATLIAASSAPAQEATSELHFARLQYETVNRCPNIVGRFRQAWTTDQYEAEDHFTEIVTRLTRVDTGNSRREYRSFSLLDDELFDYPWLYAVEVGHWQLSQTEADRLREYLLRGGFLMVDDFHGPCEWQVFMESLQRAFPDRPVVDIPPDHEIFQLLYNLDQFTQIWGIILLGSGITHENGGVDPHWRGIYDDEGRLMIAINHNMDLGDAWEHANDARYPTELTGLASRFAVNYVIYAMTH
ncbi:MAG: DUF4159 domain-containing protein [Gammaproteobacteria bacterium]|jgi:hypothetical protein